MKKNILFVAFLATTMTTGAQLKVTSGGNVGIALSNPVSAADLSVSNNDGYNYSSSYRFGIRSDRHSSKIFNIGVAGRGIDTSGQNRAIGLQGVGGGGTAGYNYGVIGGLCTTANGAGVFGTVLHHTGINIPGCYAGFFDGNVYTNGDITSMSLMTPSDTRLITNIESLDMEKAGKTTLDNLLNMNVIKYNYIDRSSSFFKGDTATAAIEAYRKDMERITKDVHYGLSVQELQKVYPDLVKEGQDGYLSINYVELVPILVKSIQELKAELDEVKGTGESMMSRSVTKIDNKVTKSAQLLQNTPNPFTERTEIRFSLPDDARNAYIYIFDMTGKMLRQIPVDSSMQSVTINGYELSAGIYLYSLVINGQEADTKRMLRTEHL